MDFSPIQKRGTLLRAVAMLFAAGSLASCSPTSDAQPAEVDEPTQPSATADATIVTPPEGTGADGTGADGTGAGVADGEASDPLGLEEGAERVKGLMAQLDELGDVPDPKSFRPSAMLRDALFDLDALKEHFSIQEKRSGGLRMHAQQDPSGAWYVNFKEGAMDTAAPAAACAIEVTEHAKSAFDRFLSSRRVEANGEGPAEAASGLLGALGALESSLPGTRELLNKARAQGREIPAHLLERWAKADVRSARYHSVPVEWGDETWAGILRGEEAAYGNIVVARRHMHVILLEWRGPALEDGDELLAFVEPHLNRIAKLKPGESWVEEWHGPFEMTHEKDE